MKSLRQATLNFSRERQSYYKQLMCDFPLVLSRRRHRELEKLQQFMEKLIVEFVDHIEEYQHLASVGEEAKRVIRLWREREYQIGTFRTDFVIDQENQFKLIEITCRFAFNGYFSYFFSGTKQDVMHQNITSPRTCMIPILSSLNI
jgi:glutathionylspermidine synthase